MPSVLSGSRLFFDKLWQRLSRDPLSMLRRARPYLASPAGLLSVVDVWRTANRISAQYKAWLALHAPDAGTLHAQAQAVGYLSYQPLISVLVPVYNTDERWLRAAIDSVLAQTYRNWELCLADDASTAAHVRPMLEACRDADPRIKLVLRPEGGHISAASNSALALATGEYIALLDHDDELAPDALYEVVRLLNDHPEADLIYSDEDKIDADGQHTEPYFKPSWSPSLLLNMNYITHFAVLRRELVVRVGGFRAGYEGSQDHDLFLRVAEQTSNVYHIPRVLYHWRKIRASAASIGDAKSYAYDASVRAVADAAKRRGLRAGVEPGLYPPFARVRHRIDGRPRVSVIIPEESPALALQRKTAYQPVEFVTAHGGSLREALSAGAARARGDYLLFVSLDLVPGDADWLTALLEYAQLPGVGCVGPKIIDNRGRIRHAGLVVRGGHRPHTALDGVTDVPHILFVANGYKDAVREVSAVSAACMMVEHGRYEDAGGFASAYANSLFDTDLCLRLRQRGYTSIYTPYAKLITKTAASANTIPSLREQATFSERWHAHREMYYSPHLTSGPETFGLRAAALE